MITNGNKFGTLSRVALVVPKISANDKAIKPEITKIWIGKQKHKMRWPVCYSLRGEVHMLKSEVIKKLAQWGIEINSPNTLKNWEDWGLIPQATFRNSRTTQYPDETAAEAFASEKLRRGEYKVNKEKARQIREKALGFEKKDSMGAGLLYCWASNHHQ
ncbi:MAG: hypothetical protein KGZ79_03020 [Dethiobacter sp.]|jgi:hypothetical protein|nr:hypothetical protein [Dethiobacter sp.]